MTNPLRPQEIKIPKHSLIEQLQDPTVLILSICMLVSLCLSSILLVYVCKMKKGKGRPRVNKRIIVNKNITPLTYRPQSTTQECEITIENCCNMNVCETVSSIELWKYCSIVIMLLIKLLVMFTGLY